MKSPLIFDYVTSKTGETGKPFVYDYSKDMNVLKDTPLHDFY